jgi:alkanesulfonate monooxygenase SsuD/methylene tetrahydromethanopterin reductase-like flavin-dependent oxidoreductase (luciferase family)
MKLRKAALKAGAPREYGKAGPGRNYWIKEIREREADYVRRAERAYERMVAAWKEKPPTHDSGHDRYAWLDNSLLSAPSVVRQMWPSSGKREKAS